MTHVRIPVEIETHDRKLAFDIAGANGQLSVGTIVDIPGGAHIQLRGMIGRKAFGIAEVLQFIIDASVNVDLALVAAWLYDKVKTKNIDRITIRRRVITEITEDGIRQVLEEEIRG